MRVFFSSLFSLLYERERDRIRIFDWAGDFRVRAQLILYRTYIKGELDILVQSFFEDLRSIRNIAIWKIENSLYLAHLWILLSSRMRVNSTDSRAPFPRPLGPTSDDTLVRDAGASAQELMSKLDNISFSALAIVPK